MTNKELQDLLKQYPDEMKVVVDFENYRYEDREQTEDVCVGIQHDAVIIFAEADKV